MLQILPRAVRSTSDIKVEICFASDFYECLCIFEEKMARVQDVRPYDRSGMKYSHVWGLTTNMVLDRQDDFDACLSRLYKQGVRVDNLSPYLFRLDKDFELLRLTEFLSLPDTDRVHIIPNLYNMQRIYSVLLPFYTPRVGDLYPNVGCYLRSFESMPHDIGAFLDTPGNLRSTGASDVLLECLENSDISMAM